MPYLIELLKTGAKIIHQLDTGTYQIGRHLDSDLFISNDTVSRYHAEIIVTPHSTTIRDCQSSNGTYINGTRIRTSSIQEGDSVELGLATFRFTAINPLGYQSSPINFNPTVINKSTSLVNRDSSIKKTTIPNLKDYKVNGSHLKIIKKSTIILELSLKLLSIREPEQLLRMVPTIVLMLFSLF